jgi:hypothetical protein
MSGGIRSRPPVGAFSADAIRPAGSVTAAAPTELPPAKTVSPTAAVVATGNDAAGEHAAAHDPVLDPQTREVIYRALDARSSQAGSDASEEAMQRVRAYAQTFAKRKTRSPTQTDLEV